MDSTIPLLSKSKTSSLYPSSVTVQPDLCRTWSEPKLLVFSRTGSFVNINLVFADTVISFSVSIDHRTNLINHGFQCRSAYFFCLTASGCQRKVYNFVIYVYTFFFSFTPISVLFQLTCDGPVMRLGERGRTPGKKHLSPISISWCPAKGLNRHRMAE